MEDQPSEEVADQESVAAAYEVHQAAAAVDGLGSTESSPILGERCRRHLDRKIGKSRRAVKWR